MTTDDTSFEFSMNLKPASAAKKAEPVERWIAPPFRVHKINEESGLIHVARGYPSKVISLQLAQLLTLCDAFRTKGQHQRHIQEKLQLSSAHATDIAQALDYLIEQGLLIEEKALLTQLSESRPATSQPPALGHCFIRTANRPDALEALLDSLQANGANPVLRVWILDDSDQASAESDNSRHIQRFADQWPGAVHHLTREIRHQLVLAIAKGSGADPVTLQWLLEGDAEDPALTYGTNLNLALLLAAGQRFVIFDDDTTLDSYLLEGAHLEVRVSPTRNRRLAYLSPDQPENTQLPKAKVDVLGAHAQWLGRGIGEIAQIASTHFPSLLQDVDAALLHHIQDHSKVKVTLNGLVGDPGTDSPNWIFTQAAEDLAELCQPDPSTVNKILHRRFARASHGTQITTDCALMSTLRGIDNRDLLLPTFPQGRNEDLFFGSLTKFLYPGALVASLPFMLPHRPNDMRHWEADDFDRPASIHRRCSGVTILSDLIDGLMLSDGDRTTRIQYLVAWMRHFSKMEGSAISQIILDYLAQTQSESVAAINRTASQLDAPEWLKELFVQVIEQHLQEDPEIWANLPKIYEPLQRQTGRYADSIHDWTKAWQWCCQRDMADELP